MTCQAPTETTWKGPSLRDAYFAYRMTGGGWYSVAFGSGKRYNRGFEGRKKLAARCDDAALKSPEDTYAVLDLETHEITDFFGALLREQIEAFSSFEKTCWIQEAS